VWEPTNIITSLTSTVKVPTYTLSHDTAARSSHGVGTEADNKKEGALVSISNVHWQQQRQR